MGIVVSCAACILAGRANARVVRQRSPRDAFGNCRCIYRTERRQAASLSPWSTVDVGDVTSLAIAPDGQQVAAGSADGKIHLLSLPTPPIQGLIGIGEEQLH